MDGHIELDDDYTPDFTNEDLLKLKELFCSSVGKVFVRNLEYTKKSNDKRIFKVEFAKENMGVLFSTLDSNKHLAESSLYIPFNQNQYIFLSSLILKSRPIESYRIEHYSNKLNKLISDERTFEGRLREIESLREHLKKQIQLEQDKLDSMAKNLVQL